MRATFEGRSRTDADVPDTVFLAHTSEYSPRITERVTPMNCTRQALSLQIDELLESSQHG